ncbi:hypothetical protein AZI86_14310 [Bdellovibrio bacteriovorus]|uniref:DUF4423 domain-containing protein n=2 Tax=Bdellovibrio bacteriovorus TaxID=959 RepID=A0A150WJP4_BDEBC|nr:hypothetical protein AZI86_14310 [Bdellovibrio bacteriovorus]
MVEDLCEILDIDDESRSEIYVNTFKIHGYNPGAKSSVVRVHGWNLVSLKDFDVISRWEPMAILLVTRLNGYDGSLDFISSRLKLPRFFIQSVLDILHKKGFVIEVGGILKASEKYFEFQSKSSKQSVRKYHRSVVNYARNLMDHAVDERSLERRHIVSGAFTCSKENALRLKIKINDFLKECIEEGATTSPDDVYQLAVQFFPVTTEPRQKDAPGSLAQR